MPDVHSYSRPAKIIPVPFVPVKARQSSWMDSISVCPYPIRLLPSSAVAPGTWAPQTTPRPGMSTLATRTPPKTRRFQRMSSVPSVTLPLADIRLLFHNDLDARVGLELYRGQFLGNHLRVSVYRQRVHQLLADSDGAQLLVGGAL